MNERYSLEEVTSLVNTILEKENTKVTDSRISGVLTERRVRDYVSKGLVSKPVREGRNVYYTLQHVQEIVTVRKSQLEGMSEQYIMRYKTGDVDLTASNSLLNSNYQDEDQQLKDDAQELIRDRMKNRNITEQYDEQAFDKGRNIRATGDPIGTSDSQGKSPMDFIRSMHGILQGVSQSSSRNFNYSSYIPVEVSEFYIDDNKKVSLRIEGDVEELKNISNREKEVILSNILNIIDYKLKDEPKGE